MSNQSAIRAVLKQMEDSNRELHRLIDLELEAGRDTQWVAEATEGLRSRSSRLPPPADVGLQAFSIIHALCRLAMMNDVDGIRMHQVRRLKEHLQAQGAADQAKSLERLIEAQDSPRGRPIRLVPSSTLNDPSGRSS